MNFQLQQGELLSLEGDGRGVEVCCLAGVLWLTQIGQDHILRRGDLLEISRSGRVVVTALRPATLGIAEALEAVPVAGGWQLQLAGARA
jgi:Protein of unknown function (DUF2917)